MNHEKFMRRAIELSIENVTQRGGGPFGCVIVKDDKIIAEGYNKVTANNDPTAHAEVTAIRNACEKLNTFQLDDCIIYTSCEPCPMCLGAIYWARPKAVYYANTKKDAAEINFDDDFIYNEIDAGINNRNLPFIQILNSEALEAFNAWNSKLDKTEY
jgi:tRNA(Arg) A34 adenosine deaminase TadA